MYIEFINIYSTSLYVDHLFTLPALQNAHLILNTNTAMIICLICKIRVRRSGLERHLMKKHKKTADLVGSALLAVDEALEDVDEQDCLYLNPSTTPVHPIQGLSILKGLSCSLCPYYGTRSETMRHHWRQTHHQVPVPITIT